MEQCICACIALPGFLAINHATHKLFIPGHMLLSLYERIKIKKMKLQQFFILTTVLTLWIQSSFAQNINWKNLQPSQKHIVNFNIGFDNATVVGVGYGYQLGTKMPLILNIEYSMPFGDNNFDDLKTKIGGQLNIIHSGNFFATVKAYG